MKSRYLFSSSFFAMFFALAIVAHAQSSEFTYQGKLPAGFSPSNGSFQMEFKLFDQGQGGTQIGATVSNSSVPVTQGAFTVVLDFGLAAFPGAERFLEVAARKSAGDVFTITGPRLKLTAVPYSMKSKSSDTAAFAVASDTANVATRAFNSLQFDGEGPSRFVRYDNNDNVGIGTVANSSKLAVAGIIESTSGGFKFPDASTQATAGITSVSRDATLTGNGTDASPLGVASPLMVRDMDHPTRQPFFARVNTFTPDGIFATVPAGKMLIIDMVTADSKNFATTIPPGAIDLLSVPPGSGPFNRVYVISPTTTRVESGDSYAFFTWVLRMHFPAGSTVRARHFADILEIQLSGYWVDVP